MSDSFDVAISKIAGDRAADSPFGLFTDISASRYHADDFFPSAPTLSSSIAKILYDETPRHARQAHPRLGGMVAKKSTREMDLGSVAHEITLGKGGGYIVSPFDDYRTKAAQLWRDDVIESGQTSIKEKDFRAAEQMAKSLRSVLAEVPGAEAAFSQGRAETVVLWRDIGGPLCRMMMDWWDQPIIWDLKTTGNGLSDRALRMWIATGLDLQGAFYMRGLEAAVPELAGRVKWRWVFVEMEAPFEARIVEMDGATRAYGDRKAALSIEKWRKCLAEDKWPGYPRVIEHIDYAAWSEANILAREEWDADAMNMRTIHQPRHFERNVS